MIKSDLHKISKELYVMLESKAMAGKVSRTIESGDLGELFGSSELHIDTDDMQKTNAIWQSRFALICSGLIVLITAANFATVAWGYYDLVVGAISALLMSMVIYLGIGFFVLSAKAGLGIMNAPLKWAIRISLLTFVVTVGALLMGISQHA